MGRIKEGVSLRERIKKQVLSLQRERIKEEKSFFKREEVLREKH